MHTGDVKKAYMAEYTRKRRKHNRALISRWKLMKSCKRCGYKEHPHALHLDHIDPSTKAYRAKNRGSRGDALQYNWSKSKIKQELAKCQVLCANCHAIKTHEERQSNDKTVL